MDLACSSTAARTSKSFTIAPMFFAVFSYWMISLNDTNNFSIFLFTMVLMGIIIAS